MGKIGRRFLLIALLFSLWCFLFQNVDLTMAKDPNYPTKPIDFYINMGAGGSTDLSSRALIKAASKHLGQEIIPINKTGGSGAIAAMALKTAKPDGYTIGCMTVSTTFVVPFSEHPPYKDLKDMTWIMNFGSYVFPLMVRGDAPWKTWKELIEWARKNPRGIKFGTTGAKTADYKALVMWQVEKKENVEFTYLGFKGSPQVLSAILGGHINLYGSTVDTSTMSYIKEGKLRILAYTGKNKAPGYENIPSIKEMYGFTIPDILAVIGPPGLPDYIVDKLEDAFTKATRDPDFVKLMGRMNMPIVYMDRPTLVKFVDDTYSKTAKIFEGLKAEGEKGKK